MWEQTNLLHSAQWMSNIQVKEQEARHIILMEDYLKKMTNT